MFNSAFLVLYWIFVLQRDLWWLFVTCVPPPRSLHFASKCRWMCLTASLCLFCVFRAPRDRCPPVLWSWVMCRPIVYFESVYFCKDSGLSDILLHLLPDHTWQACVLSRAWATIDGVWIGNSVYWPLIYSQLVITIYRSLTHTGWYP
jgi:hypothetical protein